MSAEEAWKNMESVSPTNEPLKPYSNLIRLNGTLYDSLIADPWFGSPIHDVHKLTPEKKAPFVIAFVREPQDFV